jgi:hypothetical protein
LKEVEVVDPIVANSTGVSNPLVLVQSMIEHGADPDALKKMMDLAERWERNQAAKQFADAIVAFQGECPMVFKSRKADRYQFASLDDIMRVAGPLLAKNRIGTSYSTPKQDAGSFLIIVHIRVGSHVEERPFCVPVADMQLLVDKIASVQKITSAQAYGVWLSYQKRYAFCAALGITVTDEDNEAAMNGSAGIDESKQKELKNLVEKFGRDRDKFLAWLGVKTFEEITEALYAKAKNESARWKMPVNA